MKKTIKVTVASLSFLMLGLSAAQAARGVVNLECHSALSGEGWDLSVQSQSSNPSIADISGNVSINGQPTFIWTNFSGPIQQNNNGFTVTDQYGNTFSVTGANGHISANSTKGHVDEDLICQQAN